MTYNYYLWMTHYLNHLEQIETLHNIGDPTELGVMEMKELFPEAGIYTDAQSEIGNLAPPDLIENPLPVRVATHRWPFIIAIHRWPFIIAIHR